MLTLWLNLGQREEFQTQQYVKLARNTMFSHEFPRTSSAEHDHRAALSKYGRLCDWIRQDLVENMDPFKVCSALRRAIA